MVAGLQPAVVGATEAREGSDIDHRFVSLAARTAARRSDTKWEAEVARKSAPRKDTLSETKTTDGFSLGSCAGREVAIQHASRTRP
jgi:hypothetical protein